MANNKLTWQELRKAVAEYAHCPEQEADSFLNALLESVVEGLKKDKQVKIKGLGIFSLKAVAPRKSVNIATGEDFTIEGYNKLTFSAESMLKESVEKRIEKPATEEVISSIVSDPLKKLGEQADEIIDILAQLGQAPENKEIVAEESMPAEIAEEPAVVEEVTEPEPAKNVEEPVATPVVAKKKCKCAWIFWTIGALVLAGAIGTGVCFHEQIIGWWQCTKIMEKPIKRSQYHDIITNRKGLKTATVQEEKSRLVDLDFENICETVVGWWESIKFWEKDIEKVLSNVVENENIIPVLQQDNRVQHAYTDELNYTNAPGIRETRPIVAVEEHEVSMETSMYEDQLLEEEAEEIEEVIAAAQPIIASLATLPRVYKQFIGTEVVTKDSRLTWIAYKYYGNKDLWVFIYEANRDIISDPARVTPGQKLRIPALDTQYLDLSNPELRQLVDQLTAEYLN